MAYAKKSLGQNFLKSKSALEKMVKAATVVSDDVVLEIGPGRGALTNVLLEQGARVIAVEKDVELVEVLEQKFAEQISAGQLQLVQGDVLEQDVARLELPDTYKLVANIPYYITGAIIRKFLETDHQPEVAALLVQKEVAERIVGDNNKETILSLSVKAYGEPRYVATVSASSFSPAPKVDSAIIVITDISKNRFESSEIDEKSFFSLVKAGFAQKRKTLSNNLKQAEYQPEHIQTVLQNCGLQEKVRAEDISTEQWFELVLALHAAGSLEQH